MKAKHSVRIRLALLSMLGLGWLGGGGGAALAQSLPGPKSGIPAGFKLIEGDILVPMDFEFTKRSTKATFPGAPGQFWLGGRIPYEFDLNVSGDKKLLMRTAMDKWEEVATLRFVPLGPGDLAPYRLHIQDGDKNSSYVGMYPINYVTIVSWCTNCIYIMAHELGHALGFWHEQARPDRDQYVSILYGNIQDDEGHNFDMHDEAAYYGPYDFDSVMHYDQCAFSVDCPAGSSCTCTRHTIDVLPPWNTQWQDKIGQRDHLSFWDKRVMSFLYPRPEWRFLNVDHSGDEDGSFLKPYASWPVAEDAMVEGGTLWIQPGTYGAVGTHTKRMTLEAPLGAVTLH